MTISPRVHLITLGVADIARSRAFYEALGWTADPLSNPHVAFFRCGPVLLSLYGRDALAKDMGLTELPPAGAITLAHNVATAEAVAPAVDALVAAGGTLLRAPAEVPWGGLVAYVADPDGHPWEICWLAGGGFAEDGSLVLDAAAPAAS